MTTFRLSPTEADLNNRLTSVEVQLKQALNQLNSALLLTPTQRGGTQGTINAGGGRILDPMGLSLVTSVLVNGGSQTGGPITGVASPPTGLSGTGGETALCTGTFTLQRQATVWLLGICSDYVLSTVAFTTSHPVYFQIDTVNQASAYGFIPVWASPGNAETRGLSTTISQIVTLASGSHTVNIMWNSEETTHDTCHNSNNPLFVFLMGS
jgi:hypothetical protein